MKGEGEPSDSPRLESGNTSSRVTPPQQSIATLFKKAAAANNSAAGGPPTGGKAEGQGDRKKAAGPFKDESCGTSNHSRSKGASKDATEPQDRSPAPRPESLASPRAGSMSAPPKDASNSETTQQEIEQITEDASATAQTSQQMGVPQPSPLRTLSQRHADHVPKQATVSSILDRASPRKSAAASAAPSALDEATDDQLRRPHSLHSSSDMPHASEPGRRGSSGPGCPAQIAKSEAAGDNVPLQRRHSESTSQPRPHADQPVVPKHNHAAQAQMRKPGEQCTSQPAQTSPDDISDMQPQEKCVEGSTAPAARMDPQPKSSVKRTAAEGPPMASHSQDMERSAPAQDNSSAGDAPAPEELLPDVNVAEQRRIMRDIWLRQNVSKASPSAGDRGNMALTKKRLKREVEHGHGTDGGAKQLRINNMFRAPAK